MRFKIMYTQPETLQIGYVVEIHTKHGPAHPKQGHVGKIEAIDYRGVRITHVDWLIGSFSGFDRFIPWGQIADIYIATPDHDVGLFVGSIARRCQNEADTDGFVA